LQPAFQLRTWVNPGIADLEEMDCEKYFGHKGTKTQSKRIYMIKPQSFFRKGFLPQCHRGHGGLREITLQAQRQKAEVGSRNWLIGLIG